MKLRLQILMVLFLILASFDAGLSQTQTINNSTNKIQLNGKEYYLHVVKNGEGLYRISVDYGVSMSEILKANNDINEKLQVGQIIRIPVIDGRNSDSSELQQSRAFIFHTVEKGQTAYFVARKYGITVEQLYSFNPGTENGLVLGAILQIPVEGNNTNALQPADGDGNKINSGVTHIVQPKETLYGIARLYGTSVDAIIHDNPGLRDGILGIGDKIKIPARQSVSNEQNAPSVGETSAGFISGDNYLYHLIEPGQTFYSISRRYLIDVAELRAANPGLNEDDLKVGYLLRIPRSGIQSMTLDQQTDDSQLFVNHKVKRKETLFGISREYHVDMDIIKKVNPGVNFSSLNKGTIIRIPRDEWFAGNARMALVEQQKQLSTDSTLGAAYDFTHCVPNKEIGYARPVRVALLLPFDANQSSLYYDDKDSLRFTRSIQTAQRRSKVFMEFYSGTLLALDSLKRAGVNVEMSVFDIAPDSLVLKRVLSNPWLAQCDLIIGPGLAGELPLVSKFAQTHSIPLVYPISNNSRNELYSNPYLYQVNTPDSLMFDQMADDIVKQASGSSLLVILPPENEIEANLLVLKIKERASRLLAEGRKIKYQEYRPGNNDLVSIQTLVSKNSENYIVVPSVVPAEISKIIPVLTGVKEKARVNLSLFGRSEWLRMQTIEPENIYALNTTLFNSFIIDYNDAATRRFISRYRSWFHTEPHAISPYFQYSDATSAYSRFGIWGYDVTLFFISAMVQYGRNFDLCLPLVKHDEIQFRFDFKRVSNWGGFYNNGLFKLRFTPDLQTIQEPLTCE
ncbi:LysM peptidoglycan-binding domain-containing protein [Geofilum sp. OHC36d9]|uniref:LysM peptidoglycan-binding domain-containing protein n=1 Tax=Geofilum sp. OHC36d9 TaxID=3458413 RepID=UPI004034D56E